MFAATPTIRRHAGITAFVQQLPDDLTALDDDALNGLLESGTREFDEILDAAGDAPSPEQLADMQTLADQIRAVRGETTRRANEASERANEIAALRDAVHGGTDAAGETDDTATGETTESADTAAAPVVPAEEAEAVTATGARPSLGAARTGTPTTRRTAAAASTPRYQLLASAGLGTTGPGDAIDFATAARIYEQRRSGLSGSRGAVPFPVAASRIAFPANLVASSFDAQEVIDFAANESRLEGGSLTAAGTGWCAPSQIDYTVEDDGSSLAGLIDVPEIGVARGGVRFFRGADFSSVYAEGFYQTEADNIAGTAKTFTSVPCPADTEERLDAIGLGVTSGILARVGFPESIDQFMRQAMIGHQHRVSARTIAKMVTDSGVAVAMTGLHAASITILEALDLQVLDMRQRHVLDPSETIEVVLPYWVKGVIRSDYAHRNAVDSPFNVTDAMIDEWFTIRGCKVQFTYDWQSKLEGNIAFGDPAAAATAYPATVSALMYRAGTFVRGLEDVITINGLYDSALLAQNNELGLFTEQGLLVAKRGFDSRLVTIPLVIDGLSGAQAAFNV